MSERYRRGLDIAGQLASDKVGHFVESGVAEIAPDFARMVIEFALGDIYSREALDLRTRELIAIAALAADGNSSPQLRLHVESALAAGITRAEIIEVMMQVALYAGIPATLNALSGCHDLLATAENNCRLRAAAGGGSCG